MLATQAVRAAVLVFAMSAVMSISWAGSCDAINKGAEAAKITVKGKGMEIPPRSYLELQDCTIKMEIGIVQLRGMAAGVPLRAKTCNAKELNGKECSLENAISMVAGHAYKDAGRPMDKDIVRKHGMPRGDVYSVDAAARFDLSQVQGGPASFVLLDAKSKRPVFEGPVVDNGVAVPGGVLQRGNRYSWEVYGRGGRGSKLAFGVFRILTEAEAEAVARDLAALEADESRVPIEKLFDELSVYYTHDLSYEAEIIRATIKEQP